VNSERLSDYLVMAVFVLGSLCFLRWLYAEAPNMSPIVLSLSPNDDGGVPLAVAGEGLPLISVASDSESTLTASAIIAAMTEPREAVDGRSPLGGGPQ
jgi:hypothetical protein